MQTFTLQSENAELVNALRKSEHELQIKPTLAGINLMYIQAFKKEADKSSDYLSMLEDVWNYISNKRWVALSDSEVLTAWIDEAEHIVSSGFVAYQDAIKSHTEEVK